MGCGTWSSTSYCAYAADMGRSLTGMGTLDMSDRATTQSLYTSRRLNEALNPLNVIRECVDSEEHPNVFPVILALDVTGSMGSAANEVAAQLNSVMSKLYEKVKDIEFSIMAIGDLSCDEAPIQFSQFESDIRIAEAIDKIYFEGGGGSNEYESYTAAWYMALKHTKIDAMKRGIKPVIITLGDEVINPYLPGKRLNEVVGEGQASVETPYLWEQVKDKFDIFHIQVDHSNLGNSEECAKSFKAYLPEDHVAIAKVNTVPDTITDFVMSSYEKQNAGGLIVEAATKNGLKTDEDGNVVW